MSYGKQPQNFSATACGLPSLAWPCLLGGLNMYLTPHIKLALFWGAVLVSDTRYGCSTGCCLAQLKSPPPGWKCRWKAPRAFILSSSPCCVLPTAPSPPFVWGLPGLRYGLGILHGGIQHRRGASWPGRHQCHAYHGMAHAIHILSWESEFTIFRMFRHARHT